jgi:hypothetical protein
MPKWIPGYDRNFVVGTIIGAERCYPVDRGLDLGNSVLVDPCLLGKAIYETDPALC